ncbi:hypothetical protein ACH4A2_17420, partial [Streptomyces termitum]
RDGDQLVGAVMTFTDRRPYEQLVEKHTTELAAQAERYAALAARHARLTAVLADSPRGPLEEPAPVVVTRHPTTLGTVVTAGIDKAAALTGPHRTQFAVHAPPVVVTLDPAQTSTALAHLIADASGVASSGEVRPAGPATPRADTTVVITAAVRGDELRIEICGPRAVHDPAHLLVARGVIAAHGGALTTREQPRGGGFTHLVRIPHTPPPAPAPAVPTPLPLPLPQPDRTLVAGSWIIGAAISAHRARTATASHPVPLAPAPAARRPRPYAVPLRHPRPAPAPSPRTAPQPRRQEPAEPARQAGGDTDDAARRRIVRLLAEIRRQPA